jgi:hypothetical protein
VSGCYYPRNPDGSSLDPGYRAVEKMFAYFAWLQLNESRRKVVSPAAEGMIYLRGF